MEILQKEDSGLASAWILATLGPRRLSRKIYSVSISDVSIPSTCDTIQSYGPHPLPLRLSSNLMYGLSLLYKQKVDHMFSAVSSVHSRLTMSFANHGLPSKNSSAVHSKSSGPIFLKDDNCFDIEHIDEPPTALVPDTAPSISIARILGIQENDNERNAITGTVSLAVSAEERDRSFNEFMKLTTASFQPDVSENQQVDFAFNSEGDIIGDHQFANPSQNFLDDINLEEDYVLTTTQLEDLSKSATGTNDPHFSTTLNASGAALKTGEATRRKRRKVQIDSQCFLPAKVKHRRRLYVIEEPFQSISDIFNYSSAKDPPFLNLCLRSLYGLAKTSCISRNHLPSKARHTGYSARLLDSFIENIDDIEKGRDVPLARRSSSQRSLYSMEEEREQLSFGSVDLQLDWGLEHNSFLDDAPQEEYASTTLSQFYEYIKDMKEPDQSHVSFEKVVPSVMSGGPVATRKIAASSFASLLELSSKSMVNLRVSSHSAKFNDPNEISIICLQ
ncbi:putative meiotic recombination protein [Clavispora lusitaniae]|uniref:Meiotic recombination protein n=1 Tax=Clavispora lusitaniae TaxID=36911 RepID=A0ACD0WCV5_CLALS|nr:putative meiotic recombination protein [Clavispora lusitaniae]QFZ31344.1 putative meiotic recombination protein [Clavispora lusitaniae]QFZ37012.1 putative meiotic recombination protein [Clavispora lusitaniae]QFZ42696.1 putative meiotic recombination protein [Clavispora lusitaniae]QFZ48372.1 putative meiotic recombination protein [Clavispora lusitaniae]